MSSSYICIINDDKTQQKPELWLHDTYASILSCMIGVELLTDITLGDWAALAGQQCFFAAVEEGAGVVNPGLYEHAHSVDRLRAIRRALERVELKLEAYDDKFPGSYFAEHNMLPPSEWDPPYFETKEMIAAVKVLKAETEQLLTERFGVTS